MNMPFTMAHVCNPRANEVKTTRSGIGGRPGLYNENFAQQSKAYVGSAVPE